MKANILCDESCRIMPKRFHIGRDDISILVVLFCSGTVCLFVNHAFLCFTLLFVWGCYAYFQSIKQSKGKFINPSTKWVVILVIMIWINYLIINPYHTSHPTLPYVYTLTIVGTYFICASMEYSTFKKKLLQWLSVILIYSLTIFILCNLGVLHSYRIMSGFGKEIQMFGIDVVTERMASIWWEPSAFQVVLNLTLLLYTPDIINRRISRNDKYRLGLVVICLLCSQSTSGYLCFMVIATIILFYRVRKRKYWIWIVPSLLLAYGMVMYMSQTDVVRGKLSMDYGKGVSGTNSMNVRYYDNMAMLQMIKERPVGGYGMNSVEERRRSILLDNKTSSNGILQMCTYLGLSFFFLYVIALHSGLKRKITGINVYLVLLLFLYINCYNGMIFHSLLWCAVLNFKTRRSTSMINNTIQTA